MKNEDELHRQQQIDRYLEILHDSDAAPRTPPDFERTTADLLIECLEQEGVKYIFGIPGEETLDLMNAIEKSSIQFITTRHEQGAAFMADVYGRLTGKTGVCLSTLGPGATNLVTGVADANLDGAPVLAITGQIATDRLHLTAHQYLNLEKVFEPITKKSKQILRPDTVPEIVRIAFKYAESEKPGAVHIDLPDNVAKMPAQGVPMRRVSPQKGIASYKDIERAARRISRAKRPLILAGYGAVRGGAAQAITDFATELHIPVANTMMAKGIIPFDNPYSMWTIGIPQRDYINQIFDEADTIIGIGYDIVECFPRKWNPDNNHKILHIGNQAAHINKRYQPEVQVIGDISDSLYEILRRSERETEPDYALAIKAKIQADHDQYENDDAFPMKPQRILHDVRKVMGREDIVLSDVGAHKMWIARHYNCYKPNTCIISNGFASMGIAIPGAVAAKLVNPDKKVLAVTGDGGFMMNMQELETAARIGSNFTTLILNDSSYGLIKWKQMEHFNHHCYVDFNNPDFVKLAEVMGGKGYRVEKAEDLIPMLKDALAQDVPTLVDCRVDYDENMKLSQQLAELTESAQTGK
ncbi:acetolactate synthase large subunit [Anaerovorax odorimutans]|uniref:Acetolactate synthase large subunit n=1 Tax=Anaerovorax odorimutans TaxID=109327 RepID=A0ABT1RLH8_9FIRM|nr:acetolactate synthase large subunit [Anaerovorax odorimutans]MCQ4636051.1 acetolactate synthase large subunit [Anaerovorax odorimutans]